MGTHFSFIQTDLDEWQTALSTCVTFTSYLIFYCFAISFRNKSHFLINPITNQKPAAGSLLFQCNRVFQRRLSTMPPVGSKMDSVQLIDEAIKNNRIVVFSKTFCPWCKKVHTSLTCISSYNSTCFYNLLFDSVRLRSCSSLSIWILLS